jgi:SAM-dependent methyltransferase
MSERKTSLGGAEADHESEKGMTKYRDDWIAKKRVDPLIMSQISQTARLATERLRAMASQMVEITQKIARTPSFRDFYDAVERSAEVSRAISYLCHNLRVICDSQVPPAPDFTDHFNNQFFLMSAFKFTWWVEGPAFCGLAIEPGSRVLEIGCGTGYYTEIFFSPFASEIVAVDIDPRAIETARRYHQAKNIRYEVLDIRQALPTGGPFNAILWTPSIFAYDTTDIDLLMKKLRGVMTNNGCLLGWTAVEVEGPSDSVLWCDVASLGARLKKYFTNVRVFERRHITIQPPRHQLYFYASDGPLPFDQDWQHGIRL